MRCLLALTACALLVAPVKAHDIKIASGKGLVANCTYKSDDRAEVEYHFGFCIGFIKGVMNAHYAAKGTLTICIPDEADNGDLRDVVIGLALVLPADMQDGASSAIIIAALENAYECKPKAS